SRNHIARVSASSGTVDPSWDPDTGNNNAPNPVRSITVSPDGSTVYFAGNFTTVAGQPRPGIGAFISDAAGNRLSPWVPPAGAVSAVSTITLSEDNSRLYFGGKFSKIRGQVRNNLAAVDTRTGALTPWDPNATGSVSTLMASGNLVYAGGTFTNLGATPRTYL